MRTLLVPTNKIQPPITPGIAIQSPARLKKSHYFQRYPLPARANDIYHSLMEHPLICLR
jgi:hypothetical protein